MANIEVHSESQSLSKESKEIHISKEEILPSTETPSGAEYSGQRDLDPNHVECFLTNAIELQEDNFVEDCNNLSCQICQVRFEGSTSRHRLLEHMLSIHNFNIYNKGSVCSVSSSSFATSRAFELHKSKCNQSLCAIRSTSEAPDSVKGVHDATIGDDENNKENGDDDTRIKSKSDTGSVKEDKASDDQHRDNLCMTENSSANPKNVPNTSFKCYICSTVLDKTGDFKLHLMISHEDKINAEDFDDLSYRCKKCAETFPNLILLRGHFFQKHAASIIYRCIICHITLKTKKSLRIHYNSIHEHKSKGLQSCDECGKELINIRALKAHIRQKHGGKSHKQGFRCRICQEKFDTKDNRKLHYENEHLGESPFICVDCGKGFSSKSGLYGHRQLHKTDQPSTCPYCGKNFTRKDSYHEHILIHVGPRHPCPHCPKEFVQRSNLVRHIRIHTGQKPYTCTFCDKRFSDKGACNSHIRVHTKEEQCTCPYCGQTFTKKQKLKYHMRKHTGEGLLSCEICSKTFTNAFALKEHRAIHDRQTQTICGECGKAFNSGKYLQRHIALVHQETKDSTMALRCPMCEKTFYQQTRLKSHLVTHLGKKHLQCLICKKRYSSTKSLRHHLQSSHNLNPDQPEYKKSVHSSLENTQISVEPMQSAKNSNSLKVDCKTTKLRYLLKKDDAIDSTNSESFNDNGGKDWTSELYDRKLIMYSSGDRKIIFANENFGDTAVKPESTDEYNFQNFTKDRDTKNDRVDAAKEKLSIDSRINTNGKNFLKVERNYKLGRIAPLNLVTAKDTAKIRNDLDQENLQSVIPNLVKKPLNVENKIVEINTEQVQSHSSAIISDNNEVRVDKNRCEINDTMGKLLTDSNHRSCLQTKSGSHFNSSKEMSRRRKQLRTPKKYVSPVEELDEIECEWKNILPKKKERVEAIAKSLSNSTNFNEKSTEKME
ncbi:zinc finger protein 33A-like [Athalia rosae]|uniref:zinc finger protein 33A-like n=1 Tax=Athalia rosae TaxID=37344 RepID=UPI0020338EFB|nr:zinc finger protein 33A-like [Athalia rosae]